MNNEVKMLRDALKRLLDAARETAEGDTPGMRQADFALHVTSGKLPPDYSFDDVAGKFYPMYRGRRIVTEKGRPRSFDYESNARLFCWEQWREEEAAR